MAGECIGVTDMIWSICGGPWTTICGGLKSGHQITAAHRWTATHVYHAVMTWTITNFSLLQKKILLLTRNACFWSPGNCQKLGSCTSCQLPNLNSVLKVNLCISHSSRERAVWSATTAVRSCCCCSRGRMRAPSVKNHNNNTYKILLSGGSATLQLSQHSRGPSAL